MGMVLLLTWAMLGQASYDNFNDDIDWVKLEKEFRAHQKYQGDRDKTDGKTLVGTEVKLLTDVLSPEILAEIGAHTCWHDQRGTLRNVSPNFQEAVDTYSNLFQKRPPGIEVTGAKRFPRANGWYNRRSVKEIRPADRTWRKKYGMGEAYWKKVKESAEWWFEHEKQYECDSQRVILLNTFGKHCHWGIGNPGGWAYRVDSSDNRKPPVSGWKLYGTKPSNVQLRIVGDYD